MTRKRRTLAWTTHEEAITRAEKTFDKALASALKARNEAITRADKAYEEAIFTSVMNKLKGENNGLPER